MKSCPTRSGSTSKQSIFAAVYNTDGPQQAHLLKDSVEVAAEPSLVELAAATSPLRGVDYRLEIPPRYREYGPRLLNNTGVSLCLDEVFWSDSRLGRKFGGWDSSSVFEELIQQGVQATPTDKQARENDSKMSRNTWVVS